MANEFEHNQLIDDYLKGNISESDKKIVESRLETDPAFKSEFEFQKDIFGVIRNSRITQLKSMLASVHVPWYYMISTGWKIAITAGVISLAGFSSYYLYNNTRVQNQKTPIELKSSDIPAHTNRESFTVPPVNDNDNPVETNQNSKMENNQIPAEDEATSSGKVTDSAIKPETLKHDNTPAEINVPEPEMDQNAGNTVDDDLNVSGNNEFTNATPDNKSEGKVAAVKIVKGKNYNFHYSFNEGFLKLYGNFNKPYEILGIHSSQGKDYFLFYNDKYYYLRQNTREIKPLELVKDKELINELNILKNNK